MNLIKLNQAKKIVNDEIKMRKYVFRNDAMKQKRKVKEMELVLEMLRECEELCVEEQRELFGA